MRCTAVLLASLLAATLAAQEPDPIFDGKNSTAWLEILKNETSARKRAVAATALGELRGKLRSTEKELEIALARSLRVDSSAAVRAQCAIALAGLRPEHLKTVDSELVEAIKAEKDSRVRKELAILFGRFPEFAKRAVPGLATALKDPDAGTRAASADALAKLGADAKDSAAALLPLLDDPDKTARQAAVFALGRIAPDNPSFVAAALLKRFDDEKDAELRRDIVVSVKLIGDKSDATIASLMKMLGDADADVQAEAARSLGLLRDAAKPAADALYKLATTSKDKGIRIDALRAFGSALGPAIRDRLKDLIRVMESDADFEVRLVAVEEIASLGMELKDDKETMTALRTRLSDQQVKVREAAAVAIRRIEKKPDPKPKDKKP